MNNGLNEEERKEKLQLASKYFANLAKKSEKGPKPPI